MGYNSSMKIENEVYMMDLATYIAEQNAKTQAWIDEDPANRWAGMMVTDIKFWNDQGIYTVEDMKRHDLETYIWDAYKDANGIRPRFMNFSAMSMEELQAEADYLSNQISKQIEEEKKEQDLSKEEFENHILEIVTNHNVDEKTAIRWDMQAENINPTSEQDVEHYYWNKGLSWEVIRSYMAKYSFI